MKANIKKFVSDEYAMMKGKMDERFASTASFGNQINNMEEKHGMEHYTAATGDILAAIV